MISVLELYNSVKAQNHSEETGWVNDTEFNSFLKLSELELLDFLTGKVDQPPTPFLRKNRDWLIPFTVPKKGNFTNGVIPLPDDYFYHQNLRVKTKTGYENIDVLSSERLQARRTTYIDEIKDMFYGQTEGVQIKLSNSISSEYEFIYIRYPKFGKYVSKEDAEFRDLVYDEDNSQDLEWPAIAMTYFNFKINQYINKRNREAEAAQLNLP